jgi:enoyl-CoA hydratase/carnithine racemase
MESIEVESKSSYVIVRLMRPTKKNSFDFNMFHELTMFFENEAEKYKCIILTGTGTFFSAGVDVEFVDKYKETLVTTQNNIIVRFMNAMMGCPIPICAVLNGPAIGIGCTLLLWCDFVYHMQSASFVQTPFIQLGLTPDFGSSTKLARMFGKSTASEMLFNARRVSPQLLSSGCVDSIDQVIHEKINVLLEKDIEIIKKYKILSKHGSVFFENESLRETMRSLL